MASILPRLMPSRRWLQFSLRTIMLFMLACGVWLGWYVERARRQQRAVEAIEAAGGSIVYRHETLAADAGNLASDAPPGPEWLCRIIGDEYFNEVVEATLVANRSPNARPIVLADLPYLEELCVEGMRAEELEGARGLTSLKRLVVQTAHRVDLRCFLSNRNIEEIRLISVELTNADLLPLKEFPMLRSLRLDLHWAANVRQSLEHIATLHELEELVVYSQCLSDDDVAPLRSLQKLKSLALSFGQLTDQTLVLLQVLPQLELLLICHGKFTPAGLSRLNKNLVRIAFLDLGVSDAELTYFQRLPNLETLFLGETTITDTGLASLKGMPCLKYLCVDSTHATAAGIRNIQQAMPKCRISILR